MENIVLIGMPGCGKSTVGVILAKTLGVDFVDTDLIIQKREGALLQEILNERGMEAFLDAESAAACTVEKTGAVIATGGSVVYRSEAMAHLKKTGRIVYLKLPYVDMMARLSNIKTRGIAIAPGKTMADVYAERVPLYEQYADLTINCAGLTVEETVTALVKSLAE